MYQIHLKFKNFSKKITVSRGVSAPELEKLIGHSFGIKENIVGVTDKQGKFHELTQLTSNLSSLHRDPYYLVTSKDLINDNISFEYYQRQERVPNQNQNEPESTTPQIQLPAHPNGGCVGIVGDLELFESLLLSEGKIAVVNCFSKTKPPQDISYEYYLYHDSKNSTIVYNGSNKICEFFVQDWSKINPQVVNFIRTLSGQIQIEQLSQSNRRSGEFKQGREQSGAAEAQFQSQRRETEEGRQAQLKQSFLENLGRLLDEGTITQLQFYRLKSQVLENPQDFVRKHQMGTRQGLRNEASKTDGFRDRNDIQRVGRATDGFRGRTPASRQGGSASGARPRRDRSINRGKRYEIPIIVRKYNNVVEKISTSYPLTLQQQQAINLILELELKGLISQKQAGLFKSLILQQDQETFRLFDEYFQGSVDQIQLASRLRRKKGVGFGNQEIRERGEHSMRLLIKHAKQSSYELLRRLANEGNRHVLGALDSFRATKNAEALATRLQKVAAYYRAKQELEEGTE